MSDANAAATSQTNLGQAADQAATVTEQASRRQLSAASAFNKLEASIDPVVRAQQALERGTRTAERALSQGVIGADSYARALSLLEARYASVSSAAQRSAQSVAAAWRDLGSQGSQTLANVEASRRLGSLGTPVAANQNLAKEVSQGARDQALTNIGIQGKDFIEQVLSGSSPLRAGLMQLPTAATIAGQAGLGAGDVVTGLGEKIKGLAEGAVSAASKIPAIGYAIGGVTAALGAGAAAWLSYRSEQAEVEKRLEGFGRASGVTITNINALAASQSGASEISRSDTREVASIYAGTGRVGNGALSEAVGATRDLSAFLGADKAESATVLATALGDVSRGAGDLAQKYGLLNAATVESVQRLDAQGSRLEAQRRLIDAIRESTAGLAAETTGWGKATQFLGGIWDATGAAIDKAVTGGTLDERLAAAKDRLTQARSEAGSSFMAEFGSGYSVQEEEKTVARLQKLADARDATAKRLQQNQRSEQVGSILKSLQPELTELQTMQDRVTLLRKAISDPMEFGLSGSRLAETEGALGRLGRMAQTLREDMEKYGSASVAALNRTADFESRVVGFTPYGRSAAEINERFAREVREKSLDPNGRTAEQVRAEYGSRLGDVSLDLPDRYNLAQRRDADLQSALTLDGLRRARDVELSNLQRTESLSLTPQGGAFSQMSSQVQSQILEAARTSGSQISAGIIAAIAKGESSGNLNVGFSRSLGEDGRASSAYGLGQITRGTAEDAIRRGFLPAGYDRTNPDTMAQGIAGVLQMKLQDVGGDLTKALEAYRGSSDPAVNRAYAATALRNAGQMGDASQAGLVRDQDALTRSQRDASQQLDNLNRNYGVNGAALETIQQRQQKYNELLDRGVSASDAASIAFGGLIDKTVSLAQQAKLVQFARDDDFARQQLGRDATDQQAYARARQLVGDTISPNAQSVINRTRDTLDLTEAKSMITSGASSFVTEFRRTGDAAAALSNAFGSAADKLLSKVIDAGVSGLFSSATSSSGSSFFGSLFKGFDVGGYTGPGGRLEPAGIVHRGEYVIDAATVSRLGVGTLDALRSTRRGYADGGLVGGPPPSIVAANPNNGPSINAPITVNMQGSSGDPAQDQAHVEATVKSMREEMRRVFHQEQSNSLRQNGALWQAGVRRAA
ncbi:phage tail length tape measure family protein [Methylobacterium gnaphalii]|uniref:phage tail length tape measure family protein n=1 Tax=Methylobacterium gnaphalii TaxID=1010610 RepID=UPI001478E91F|nr:phage tail length tape measure family protein [Methylobacterium gnaphalii]